MPPQRRVQATAVPAAIPLRRAVAAGHLGALSGLRHGGRAQPGGHGRLTGCRQRCGNHEPVVLPLEWREPGAEQPRGRLVSPPPSTSGSDPSRWGNRFSKASRSERSADRYRSNNHPHLHYEQAIDANGDGRASWGAAGTERVQAYFDGTAHGTSNGQTFRYVTSRNCPGGGGRRTQIGDIDGNGRDEIISVFDNGDVVAFRNLTVTGRQDNRSTTADRPSSSPKAGSGRRRHGSRILTATDGTRS